MNLIGIVGLLSLVVHSHLEISQLTHKKYVIYTFVYNLSNQQETVCLSGSFYGSSLQLGLVAFGWKRRANRQTNRNTKALIVTRKIAALRAAFF